MSLLRAGLSGKILGRSGNHLGLAEWLGGVQQQRNGERICTMTWEHSFIHPYPKPNGSRKWQPTPVFLPGKFHGQRSPVGYIHGGVTKSQTGLNAYTHTHTHTHPNPNDRGGHQLRLGNSPGQMLSALAFLLSSAWQGTPKAAMSEWMKVVQPCPTLCNPMDYTKEAELSFKATLSLSQELSFWSALWCFKSLAQHLDDGNKNHFWPKSFWFPNSTHHQYCFFSDSYRCIFAFLFHNHYLLPSISGSISIRGLLPSPLQGSQHTDYCNLPNCPQLLSIITHSLKVFRVWTRSDPLIPFLILHHNLTFLFCSFFHLIIRCIM